MNELFFDPLPDLPQCITLRAVATHLWSNKEIMVLWIEGSLARGGGDLYSDVDLHVVVAPELLVDWKTPGFAHIFTDTPVIGKLFIAFGEHAFLHNLTLANGEIFDLFVQDTLQPLSSDAKLVLGCRNADLAQKLQEKAQKLPVATLPAYKEQLRQIIESFWINTHKHRKVLHRDLAAMTLLGLAHERNILLRLWYIRATDEDCGDLGRSTIHSLTRVIRTVQQHIESHVLERLGAPMRSREEIYRAIEGNRHEVAEVGRWLAQKYDFVYPEALEMTVQQGWQQFLVSE
jgi:hypothetical protein